MRGGSVWEDSEEVVHGMGECNVVYCMGCTAYDEL